MLQRIALYTALGLCISYTNIETFGALWWCMLALFWAAEHGARVDGMQEGIWITATLPLATLQDIQQQIKKIEEEENK
jgi:hypothetical protein